MYAADDSTNSNTTHAPLHSCKHVVSKLARTAETASQVAKAISLFINRSLSPEFDLVKAYADWKTRFRSAELVQKRPSAEASEADDHYNKTMHSQPDYTGSNRLAYQPRIIMLEPTTHDMGRDSSLLRAVAGRYNQLTPSNSFFYCKRVETDRRRRSECILTLASGKTKKAPPTLDQRWKGMLLIKCQLCHIQSDAHIFLQEDFPQIVVHQLPSGATPATISEQNPHLMRGPRINGFLGNTRTMRLTTGPLDPFHEDHITYEGKRYPAAKYL